MNQNFVNKIPNESEVLSHDPDGRLIGELWYTNRNGGRYTANLTLHEYGLGRIFRLHNALFPTETFTCPWTAVKALETAYAEWLRTPDHFPVDSPLADIV